MEGGLAGVEDILLVEDNPGDRRLIEEAFRSATFNPTIHATTTQDEALTYLKRSVENESVPIPDLILLDWNLSQNTGEEVIQAARSVQPAIPVVVMTGSKSALQPLPSSTPEADEYIEKQHDPEKYIEILHSCLAEL